MVSSHRNHVFRLPLFQVIWTLPVPLHSTQCQVLEQYFLHCLPLGNSGKGIGGGGFPLFTGLEKQNCPRPRSLPHRSHSLWQSLRSKCDGRSWAGLLRGGQRWCGRARSLLGDGGNKKWTATSDASNKVVVWVQA